MLAIELYKHVNNRSCHEKLSKTYQQQIRTNSFLLAKELYKHVSNRSCHEKLSKTYQQQIRTNSFLLFKRANASMRFMYQSIPSVTIPRPGNPRENCQNLPNPGTLGKQET